MKCWPVLATIVVSGSFLLGCGETPTNRALDPSPQMGKGGGKPGGGEDGGITLALSGGFETSSDGQAELDRDNKKYLSPSSTGQDVTIVFDDTKSEAESARNGLAFANDYCTTSARDGAELDGLLGALVDSEAKSADQIIGQFLKRSIPGDDPAHWLRVKRTDNAADEPFIDLNFSTRAPDLHVAMDAASPGGKSDSDLTRILALTGGVVKVTRRIDNRTVIALSCDQASGDRVTLTITPMP